MNGQRATISPVSAGPGESHKGKTPQASNPYSKMFLAAQGTWFKVATAESCFRFLGTAQELGVNTNDVQNFLENQMKLRKIKTDAKHNSKLHKEHLDIGNNLMSLKVADQALVLDEARAARDNAHEQL